MATLAGLNDGRGLKRPAPSAAYNASCLLACVRALKNIKSNLNASQNSLVVVVVVVVPDQEEAGTSLHSGHLVGIGLFYLVTLSSFKNTRMRYKQSRALLIRSAVHCFRLERVKCYCF